MLTEKGAIEKLWVNITWFVDYEEGDLLPRAERALRIDEVEQVLADNYGYEWDAIDSLENHLLELAIAKMEP